MSQTDRWLFCSESFGTKRLGLIGAEKSPKLQLYTTVLQTDTGR